MNGHGIELMEKRRRQLDFADGRRTLHQVIDEMMSHQAAHLAAIKRALT